MGTIPFPGNRQPKLDRYEARSAGTSWNPSLNGTFAHYVKDEPPAVRRKLGLSLGDEGKILATAEPRQTGCPTLISDARKRFS